MIIDRPQFDGPRAPRSFGLRVMLVAITTMAVILGVVVWLTS